MPPTVNGSHEFLRLIADPAPGDDLLSVPYVAPSVMSQPLYMPATVVMSGPMLPAMVGSIPVLYNDTQDRPLAFGTHNISDAPLRFTGKQEKPINVHWINQPNLVCPAIDVLTMATCM